MFEGPRTRAPLGMKTTNAKAKAFQTPAPLSESAKTQKLSPRLRRPKVKVHQAEDQVEQEDNVPDIEYMPPREIPLPDNLDEDMPPINWDFPQFKGENMMRGADEIYINPVEDDGRTRNQRLVDEAMERMKKQAEEEHDRHVAKIAADEDAHLHEVFGGGMPKKSAPQSQLPKRTVAAPSTIKARSAAAALSAAPKASYAAPTAAAKSKGLLPGKKATKSAIAPSATRHAAATAASKSTIGYAQGRPAANARKPLSSIARPAPSSFGRPTTASSTQARNPANGSGTSRTGRAFTRSISGATDTTLVADAEDDQSQRTEEDIEHEMQILALTLQAEADGEVDAWMDKFGNHFGEDPLEEEYADFQLQFPDSL
jgi:hypothetical protein